MGFDRRRSRDSSQSDETGNDTGVWDQDDLLPSQSSDEDLPGPNPSVRGGFERAEEYYGREFDDHRDITRVRRVEKNHGEDVHDWIEEGVPIRAMGDPDKMEAYREHKGTPIPWNIERENQYSEQRNTGRAARRRRETPNGYARVTDSVRDVLSSPGRSLDEPIQRAMEERMGDSFGDVQIHAGPKAAEAAEQINARAFTVGNHIAFNHSEYDPSSAEGQRVIAHELAHVRQQTGGALSMLPQEDLQLEIDPDPELEREAEGTAERVMSGGELDIQRLPLRYANVHVQRDHRKQKRNNGKFGELKQEHREKRNDEHPKAYLRYNHPEHKDEVVEQVWEDAKNERGEVFCEITKQRLTWDRSEDRGSQWVMGHKPGYEYKYLVAYLLRDIISYEEFKQAYHNPEYYRPEAPNQDHEHEQDGDEWKDKWGELNLYNDD